MSKRTLSFLLAPLFILSLGLNAFGQASALRAGNQRSSVGASMLPLLLRYMNGVTEREQDGLNGPVRRVRTETAKLANKNGQMVEGQRVPLEVAAYDIKGAKIENAYYPIPGASITGKEVYKYDDKGNIIEMTLQDEKGTLLSKETYSYEFDQFGNWVKMTTSVAIIENGKLKFEPTEVTYRTISYYLDEATLAKMNQPAAPAANTGAAGNAAGSNTASNNNAPASNAQPASSATAKPTTQPNAPANNTASNSNQSSSTVAANNKPAAASSSDASRQTQQSQSSNTPSSTSAPIVKSSAPVSDKPAAAQSEQAGNSASTAKAVESKPAEDTAPKQVIKPLLKPVSGGVLNGKALNLPKPAYPLTARSARLSGIVVVEVVIDVNGKVISARAVSGPVLLQQSAVQAAYQAKFSPTILSGQPVKVVGTINYNFLAGQ